MANVMKWTTLNGGVVLFQLDDDGSLTIKNSSGTTTLAVDASGNITQLGGFEIGDSDSLNFGDDADILYTHNGTASVRVTNAASGTVDYDDDVFQVVDPAAPTKKARLDVVDVTAGQTRVLSVPDMNLGVSGTAYANTAASAAITGTTETKAAFDAKKTIAANTLKAGAVIHIVAQGIHTATTGAETHSISLEIGGLSITANATVDPADNDIFAFEAWLIVRTIGASGTVVGYGRKRVGATGTAEVPFILASSTLDTTAANDVAVYIDRQATATDSDSARVDVMIVEVGGVPL